MRGLPARGANILSTPFMRLLAPAATTTAPTRGGEASGNPSLTPSLQFLVCKDHPPSHRLQYPGNNNIQMVIDVAPASFYHHHGSIVEEANTLADLLALLDDLDRHL